MLICAFYAHLFFLLRKILLSKSANVNEYFEYFSKKQAKDDKISNKPTGQSGKTLSVSAFSDAHRPKLRNTNLIYRFSVDHLFTH